MLEFFKRSCEAADIDNRSSGLSRRSMLHGSAVGATGLGLAGLAAPAAAKSIMPKSLDDRQRVESGFLFFDDPVEHQRASYRILRNLYDEADVLFWYHFIMFTVSEDQRPEAVVRWEGIELSHHKKISDGNYRVHGHNLSFPRDIRTGLWIDSTLNPLTEEIVKVPPMALTEDPGYVYTPHGVIPLDSPSAPPRIRFEQFMIEDDLVKIEQVRQPPASWPATFIETSSNWSPRDQFEDETILSLPAGTAGGYIFPWPEWLNMGDRKGHMFSTWHGKKLESIDQLPTEFLARAEGAHPELLAVDLSPFDKTLPAPLAALAK